MPKKIAVFFLFIIIGFGLFFIKKELNTKPIDSQFMILNWHHNPEKITLDNETEFIFHLKNKKNKPIENALINVEANMNHPGMIPIYTKANYLSNGIYRFNLKLNMHGDWILFLTIIRTDGTIVKKEILFKTESK